MLSLETFFKKCIEKEIKSDNPKYEVINNISNLLNQNHEILKYSIGEEIYYKDKDGIIPKRYFIGIPDVDFNGENFISLNLDITSPWQDISTNGICIALDDINVNDQLSKPTEEEYLHYIDKYF